MKYAILIFAILLGTVIANADDLRVVEVRRNIPLADNDPVYKDFFIAGGVSALKPNMVVKAVRKLGLKDATGTQSVGELNIPVGQLKVIFVQDNLAVAREFKLLSRSDLPMLEQPGIMVGDLIDVKDSFTDKRKPDSVGAAKKAAPQTSNKKLPAKKKRAAVVRAAVRVARF